MKFLIFCLFFISHVSFALNLEPGDVLLLSFNCYECRVIESETNSKFSHSGIVIRDRNGDLKVAQALGKVDLYSLKDFIKNKTPGTLTSVFRPKHFKTLSQVRKTQLDASILEIFNEQYKNLKFDSHFLWNNFDDEGRELLYCSEFVAKFLDNFLPESTIPYKLSYSKNKDYWFKYFGGIIPEGELGNSPASLSMDSRYEFVGEF